MSASLWEWDGLALLSWALTPGQQGCAKPIPSLQSCPLTCSAFSLPLSQLLPRGENGGCTHQWRGWAGEEIVFAGQKVSPHYSKEYLGKGWGCLLSSLLWLGWRCCTLLRWTETWRAGRWLGNAIWAECWQFCGFGKWETLEKLPGGH